MRRYRFGLTVTAITADQNEATDIQAAAADVLNGSPAIESVMAGLMTSEPVTPQPCRAGGEIFYTPTIPPVPEPDICHGHWYAEQIDAATARYQPLIDALHDTTGLHSTVWQSGGMTMTLLTGPAGAEPYQGRHYLTLVEQFNPDATLEGSTGWYDCDRDPNTEGEQVLLADSSLAGAQTRLHGHGVVSDRALTPTEWAQVVGQHWARSGTH